MADFTEMSEASPEGGDAAAVPCTAGLGLPTFSGVHRPLSPRFRTAAVLQVRFSQELCGLVRPEPQGMPHCGGQVLRTQGLKKTQIGETYEKHY